MNISFRIFIIVFILLFLSCNRVDKNKIYGTWIEVCDYDLSTDSCFSEFKDKGERPVTTYVINKDGYFIVEQNEFENKEFIENNHEVFRRVPTGKILKNKINYTIDGNKFFIGSSIPKDFSPTTQTSISHWEIRELDENEMIIHDMFLHKFNTIKLKRVNR